MNPFAQFNLDTDCYAARANSFCMRNSRCCSLLLASSAFLLLLDVTILIATIALFQNKFETGKTLNLWVTHRILPLVAYPNVSVLMLVGTLELGSMHMVTIPSFG